LNEWVDGSRLNRSRLRVDSVSNNRVALFAHFEGGNPAALKTVAVLGGGGKCRAASFALVRRKPPRLRGVGNRY